MYCSLCLTASFCKNKQLTWTWVDKWLKQIFHGTFKTLANECKFLAQSRKTTAYENPTRLKPKSSNLPFWHCTCAETGLVSVLFQFFSLNSTYLWSLVSLCLFHFIFWILTSFSSRYWEMVSFMLCVWFYMKSVIFVIWSNFFYRLWLLKKSLWLWKYPSNRMSEQLTRVCSSWACLQWGNSWEVSVGIWACTVGTTTLVSWCCWKVQPGCVPVGRPASC